jgi:hypothetical protein
VLTAYVDESGQDTQDYVFLGGFVGNDAQWKQFSADWKIGLGGRKGLHMRKLRWAHPRTERLLQRLGPIPHRCLLQPIVGGVRVRDYADLVNGTIEEKIISGYVAALYPLVIRTLLWVPANERVEFIFEAQDRYQPFAEAVLRSIATNPRDPGMITSDGQSKLANWRFVPKDSTTLTQPADYFVYALTQAYRDKKSERTRLCSPIFKDGPESTAIGEVLKRHQVRTIVQFTRTMVHFEIISGIELKPKTPAEQKEFNKLVQRLMAWSANVAK